MTGENPSSFTGGELPVESVSWLDAILFANAKSAAAGLTPAYTVSEDGVAWDRSANGYRLPTEAEWEYACRNGTQTPFNSEKSLDAVEANFFGKNMRSAYRAAGQSDMKAANLGIRLVRSAVEIKQTVTAHESVIVTKPSVKTLIVFFSWSGNTRGIAHEIQKQTGADLFEIMLVHPYSTSYNTVRMQAQEDQHRQARPEIQDPPASIAEYDKILLGYPNWWASIPMPIATFLESYDFAGKTIVPFCSHGGGRFGQSLTAIAKLAPNAVLGEGLSVHYSGGGTLAEDVSKWLARNNVNAIGII